MRVSAQHELPGSSNISQVWTCPYRPCCPQRPGLYPDPSCVLLYCFSQTCIPRAASKPGHVTDQSPFQLQLTQEQLGCQPSRQSLGYPMTVADRKLRWNAASLCGFPFSSLQFYLLCKFFSKSGSHSVVQAGLGSMAILMLQPPQGWKFGCKPRGLSSWHTFLTAHWKPVCLSFILWTSPKEPLPT